MTPTDAKRRARARGFTMIELVVSLAAGLMISASAFVLARQATAFFRAEATLSSAQFATMMGVTRLTSDLRRAGFMSSPSAFKDPRRCGAMVGWPIGLSNLASIEIEQGGSVVRHGADHALTAANGLDPDAIIIGGAFGTTEHFAVQAMYAAGPGWTIVLQNDGAVVRTLLAGMTMANVFQVGRFLRLIDPEGRHAFGVITGVGNNGTNWTVTIDGTPGVPVRDTQITCGCQLPCVGSLVNPVSRVLYDLRTIDTGVYTQYAGLYGTATHAAAAQHRGMAEPQRTELVRVELDADGVEIPATLEVVAEYAVDLKFGLTQAQIPLPNQPPVIVRYPIGDPNVYTIGAANGAGGQPERVRAVQVRLTTRVARGDRDRAIPNPGAPATDGIFRFNLGGPVLPEQRQRERFARTRTAITEVELANVDVGW